ncbi:MAG: hypothetical protein V3U98_12610 [Acidobacteriota bacterium]
MPPRWPLDAPEQLLNCPSIALGAEKNLVAACGIFSGGVLYMLVAGLGGGRGQGVFGNLFYASGLSLWVLCLILAAGGISRAVLQELRGEPRMRLAEIAGYLRGRGKDLLLIPLAFCALAVVGVIAHTFMAILGLIPGVGPTFYALWFTLGVAFSAITVLTTLVHVLGSPLYPAALGYQEATAATVIRELFDLVRRRPGRILLVEAALAVAFSAVSLVIYALLRLSLQITVAISHPAMKERFVRLVAGLPESLQPLFECLAGPLPFALSSAGDPASYPFSGFILGLSFLALISAAFAYPLTLLFSGGTVLYVSLRGEGELSDG